MAKYNFDIIKKEVKKKVKEACFSDNNIFTDTVWDYHILPVVRFCEELGKKLGADLEIVVLAGYLHDYAAMLDEKYYKEHHRHGARMAEELLLELGFDKNKTKAVKDCILNHRGSVNNNKETLEAKILASADAMSHISELSDMFYLTYGVHKYKTKEGVEWLKQKLERSWNKIMPEGKEMVVKDYKIAIDLLSKTIA